MRKIQTHAEGRKLKKEKQKQSKKSEVFLSFVLEEKLRKLYIVEGTQDPAQFSKIKVIMVMTTIKCDRGVIEGLDNESER